jgi:dTDP-4-dehydrorhamnose reductase
MDQAQRILLTGGSGLLGTELQRLLPGIDAPGEALFNVCDTARMAAYLDEGAFTTLIHAAAFTSPPRIDENPALALDVNIVGTANVVRLCMARGIRLVYISTDYVFRGDQGNYAEEDPVFPVNKYAWSKLGGECAVRLYDNSLIIRTTFGPAEFPFPKAFTDQWTSRETVADIARMMVNVIATGAKGIVHVGGPRKTVHQFACAVSPAKEIGELRRDEVNFHVPRDTSLDTTRYRELTGGDDPS